MAHFTITANDEFKGATVIFGDGSTQVIASDNSNYEAVVTGLLAGNLTDDELLALISPFELVYRTLTRLSERISRKGLRLRFDGDVVDNSLTKHIIAIMDGGAAEAEWSAYIRFMEKLYQNPSEESREHLFHFIEKHGLLLTPDGDAVFYKGVRNDFRATRAGYGIVNGVEFESEYLLNEVGSVVEIPRSMVDPNRGIACSVGLHVGDYSYASNHGGGKLLNVLVNPRDVVAVPRDENDRKIRVTRYKVDSINDPKAPLQGTLFIPTGVAPVVVEEAPVEAAPVEVEAVPVLSKAAKNPYPEGSRVPEYIKLIKSGGAGKNLRRFRNKSVTAGRRAEFDEAVTALGLTY